MCGCANFIGQVGDALYTFESESTAITPSALTQEKPLAAVTHIVTCNALTATGFGRLEELWFLEVGATANKFALKVLVFNQEPAAPVVGSTYVADTSKLATKSPILIASGDFAWPSPYVGYQRISATERIAFIKPGLVLKNLASSPTLWIVVLSDQAGTYAGPPSYRIGGTISRHS